MEESVQKFKWFDNVDTVWSETWNYWATERGEPNDEYDCVALGYQEGKWRSVDCSFPRPFLCQQSSRFSERGPRSNFPNPVDCSMSEWSPWSSCKNCDDHGCMIRTRNVSKKEKFGGLCDQGLYQLNCSECSNQITEIIGVSLLTFLMGVVMASLVSVHFTKKKYINTITKLKAARSLYEMTTIRKHSDTAQKYDNYDNDELNEMEETTFASVDVFEHEHHEEPVLANAVDVSQHEEPAIITIADVNESKGEKNKNMANGVYYSNDNIYYN